MNAVILTCIILVTVSIIIATVYFVITMVQISQTVKKADETLTKLNTEIDNVQKFSNSVAETLSVVPKMWVKVATAVIPVLTTIFFKRKK